MILNDFIKTGSDVLLPVLTEVFNIIPKNAWILELLVITSLYTNGDPNDTNNYRELSVTICIMRNFLQVYYNNVEQNYLENIDLLSQYQFGFWKNQRTTDNIFTPKLKSINTCTCVSRKTTCMYVMLTFQKHCNNVYNRSI